MSKLSQMIDLLNRESLPTAQDFTFYYDCLDKSLHDYALIRRQYKQSNLLIITPTHKTQEDDE